MSTPDSKDTIKTDYHWFYTVEEDHDGCPITRHDCMVRWTMHNLKLTFDGTTGKLKCAEVLEATE